MSGQINSYEDLVVWQKGVELTEEVYRISSKLPKHELYGLVSQMRRAAVSMPSNIAEGRRRGSKADFRRFLLMAYGSGAELETQIVLIQRLYPDVTRECGKIVSLLDEIMRMLNTMIARLNSD